jgi:hypothetical protein
MRRANALRIDADLPGYVRKKLLIFLPHDRTRFFDIPRATAQQTEQRQVSRNYRSRPVWKNATR